MLFTRQEILSRLKQISKNHNPIIGVAVGAGITAKYAEEGGADLILTLNSGKFRQMGVGSLAGLLPFGNNNKTVETLGKNEIIPIVRKTPVIFGLCATDPSIRLSNYLDHIVQEGFSGVVNYPTVGLIDGNFRDHLEAGGFGIDQEIEALSIARQKDIFTIGFAFTEKQAKLMVAEDIDVICIHLGLTTGGEFGSKNSLSVEESVSHCNKIFSSLDCPDKILLVYGGPIINPVDAEYVYRNTKAMGYIGGSTFERIPTEKNIKAITEQFKSYSNIKKENEFLKEELDKKNSFDKIVGMSSAMQELYYVINKVSERNVNVLIQGESGTGKELVSTAIYKCSPRNKKPFIKVNCAAIPANLLESEMFGYEHGAFTGAAKRKLGRFELANEGVLFLDEIGELPMELQPKLLRAIQEQEFERVGGTQTVHIDVRIISATNIDIEEAVSKGKFREDLYYRLNGFSINIPPLRERKEDLPYLVKSLLDRINNKIGTNIQTVSAEVMEELMRYDWPGNVRELENVLSRMAVMAEGSNLHAAYLPSNISKSSGKANDGYDLIDESSEDFSIIENVERDAIIRALEKNDYNISHTAAFMGLSRKTIQNKIKKYKINVKK